MKRQLDDYYEKFYIKEAARNRELTADRFAKAKEIAAWKTQVAAVWEQIRIVSAEKTEGFVAGSMETGKQYDVTFVVDERGLDDAIGIEMVTTRQLHDGTETLYAVEPLEVIRREGNLFTFRGKVSLSNSGSFKMAFRMFPKNPALPHRQDFCYVRWFN